MATGNNTAVFAQTPKTATAVVTAAISSLTTDAPTGVVPLLTGAPASTKLDINGEPISKGGGILTRLTAMPRGTTAAANSLLLYLSNDGGLTMRQVDSEVLPIQVVSATAKINKTAFPDYSETRPFRFGAGDRLYVGAQTALAAGIVFKAEYSDF